jgi:hypothetical protein
MEDVLAGALAAPRVYTLPLGSFAMLALTLAARTATSEPPSSGIIARPRDGSAARGET